MVVCVYVDCYSCSQFPLFEFSCAAKLMQKVHHDINHVCISFIFGISTEVYQHLWCVIFYNRCKCISEAPNYSCHSTST